MRANGKKRRAPQDARLVIRKFIMLNSVSCKITIYGLGTKRSTCEKDRRNNEQETTPGNEWSSSFKNRQHENKFKISPGMSPCKNCGRLYNKEMMLLHAAQCATLTALSQNNTGAIKTSKHLPMLSATSTRNKSPLQMIRQRNGQKYPYHPETGTTSKRIFIFRRFRPRPINILFFTKVLAETKHAVNEEVEKKRDVMVVSQIKIDQTNLDPPKGCRRRGKGKQIK